MAKTHGGPNKPGGRPAPGVGDVDEMDSAEKAASTRLAARSVSTEGGTVAYGVDPRDGTAVTEDPGLDRPAGAAGTIRVRAIKNGYYDDVRRRVGDVFDLHPRKGTFTVQDEDENGKPLLTDTIPPTRITHEEDDVELSAEDQFSPKWMEKVDGSTPKKITTGNQVLKKQHDEVIRARHAPAEPTGSRAVIGDDED